MPAGRVELYVSTVGYGLVKRDIDVAGPLELNVALGQDAIKRSEEVSVSASVFEPSDPGAVSEHTLDSSELRNLSSVVADDSLRAVQALPGVVTGDDFSATFSVRGSGFESVGLYIDGVLASSPFHTVRDVNDGYTLTILNGDVVASVALLSGAAPARYGDRVGGALSLETRDGSRDKRATRLSLGATGASFWSEGPLGSQKKVSWLVGGRKSFLDYVVNRIQDNPSFVVGYYDLQAKLSYRSGANQWSLFLLHGDATYSDDDPGQGRNSVARADAKTELASGRWRYSPSAKTSLAVNAYSTRETGRNRNQAADLIFDSESVQTGMRVDLTHALGSGHVLEAGLAPRHLDQAARENRFEGQPQRTRSLYDYDLSSWQPGAYVQDTWTTGGSRLRVTLGGRYDGWSVKNQHVWLPRASASFAFSPRSKLSAAAGRHAQFPAFDRLFGEFANAGLLPERSDHYVVGYEHLVRDNLRVRVEVYDQEESQRLFLPNSEFRLVAGRIVRPAAAPTFQNSLTGRSRGFEAFVQRRSANGVSGWISYAYGHARRTDSVTRASFLSDFDQRHTLNAYASLRVNDRLNLSAKYRYGSNLPIAGFYAEANVGFVLASERNLLRVPPYSRLDLRANRAFFFKRSKLTLYAEVANVLNRIHYRYTDASVDPRTGRVVFDRDTLFPLLPAAGVTWEF